MSEPLGCFYDPAETSATVENLIRDGLVVSFSEASESLSGFAKREQLRGVTRVLAQEAERKVNGAMRPAYRQTRGVCVSRGTAGAILDSYLYSLALGGIVGRPVAIAAEPIYAGSRQTIGRGRLGAGEGSCGSWAAEWVARYGVVARSVYGEVDLTRDDDNLACNWSSRPGQNVPDAIQNAGLAHLVSAHKIESTSEAADATWAGYFGAVCRSRYCSTVDANGFGLFGNAGWHCTEVCGGYLDAKGKLCFVEQQSHGSGRPTPNPVAHTVDGPITLRDGCYPVRDSDLAEAITRGEMWVFSLKAGHEFRGAV